MEDIESQAVKRQRLDSAGNAAVQRMQQQQYNQRSVPPTPTTQLHNSSFGPPTGGPGYPQIPPSPYDSRSIADHQQQQQHPQQQNHPPPQQPQYAQPNSGYNTPNRDNRPPFPEPGAQHLRRDSIAMAGPTRSPDEPQQQHPQSLTQHPQGPGPAMRPVNTEFGGQEYAQYAPAHPGHPNEMGPVDPSGGAYMNSDPQQPNGSYHAIPMNQPPQSGPPHPHSMAPGAPPQGNQGQPPQHAQYAGPMPGMEFGAPPGTPVYSSYQGLVSAQHGPKKNARATQACESCRQRKAKCDEGKPQCGHCKENNIECKYKDIPPAKHERAQKEMMDRFDSIKSEEERINDRIDGLVTQNKMMLELLREFVQERPRSTSHHKSSNMFTPSTPTEMNPPKRHHRMNGLLTEGRFQASAVQPAGMDGQPGGPVTLSHNTGAHRLLRWGGIQKVLEGIPLDQNYVMKLEEQKGVLHYYGKGQSQDRTEGFNPPVPSSPATPATDDVQNSQKTWGTDLGRPYLSDGRFFADDHNIGGLTMDGGLQLDWKTMESLKLSYMEHIHILHPFLNTGHLASMFSRVNQQVNPGQGGSHQGSPYLGKVMAEQPRNPKRKFSSDYGHGEPGTPGGHAFGGSQQNQVLERRISTAIVLLVLALGKICQWSEPLPGPALDVWANKNGNMAAPDRPFKAESPAPNADSPMRDAASSIPSPMSVSDRGGPATSSTTSISAHSTSTPSDGQARPMRTGDRNVDVIPGLAYYVRAVEILGVLHGGNEVAHAQAFLLAALYCSQNGCVLESWAWLQNACRVARFHVREEHLATESARNPDGANIIRFVFYTALQLESDVIAELDVQSSGIAQLHADRVMNEKEIGLPKGVEDQNTQIKLNSANMELVEMFYSYQLSMRNILNEIQSNLYPANSRNNKVDMRKQELFDDQIKGWRATLTPSITWDDDDDPSTSINEARLRAKYYGARYLIHRPSLYHALHNMLITEWPASLWESNNSGDEELMDNLEGNPAAEEKELDERQTRIYRSCKMCIKSAIHSTVAFDGIMFGSTRGGQIHAGPIKQRLIITNIFGTAHAQFGNMLVLSAVYGSYMRPLIDRPTLLRLLRRTIKFLRSLQYISSTLAHDAFLLEHIHHNIRNDGGGPWSETAVANGTMSAQGSTMNTPVQSRAHHTPMTNLTTSFSSTT